MVPQKKFSFDALKQAYGWFKRTIEIGHKDISNEMIYINGKLCAYIPEKMNTNSLVPEKSVLILSKHPLKEVIVKDTVFKELIELNQSAKIKIKSCFSEAIGEKMFFDKLLSFEGSITEIDEENEIVFNPTWLNLLLEAHQSNQDLILGGLFYCLSSIMLSRPVLHTGCWILDKGFVGGYYKLFVGGTSIPVLYVTGRDLFDGLDQNKIILLREQQD